MPKRKAKNITKDKPPNKFEKKDDVGSKKEENTKSKDETKSTLFRLSRRLESMKRKGTFTEPNKEYEEFEYLAEDCVTIRSPNKDFYLARILDDVTASSNEINVAWFDKTAKNKFKVSYDDTIYKTTIITKVNVKQFPNESNTFYITSTSLKETKELLKETLENEGENYESPVEKSEDDNDTEDTDDEEPSPKKQRRTSSQSKTKSPKKISTPKITGGKRKRGLAPNSDIKLFDQDPKFVKNSTIPLAVERQAIRAVLTNDKKSLKNLINDTKNVHSVRVQHSPHIKRTAVNYALLQEDIALLKMLYTDRKEVIAKQRNFDISQKNTGKGDFRTFGHALRDVTVSRGNKEGDNAFLLPEEDVDKFKEPKSYLIFCLKKNLSFDFILEVMDVIKCDVDALISSFHIPVQHGHLQLAAEIVNIAIKKGGYGFNVLHQELLNHKTENLKPFKAASVTKKIYHGAKVGPLFCACINPNAKYIQEVFTVLPELNFADGKGNRPIHYAAACTSDGPLKYLIARGVDPSLGNNKKVTPLMVAAKCNRPHNIKVLMECKIDMGTQGDADEGNLQTRVPINYKDRESLTALHYAAKKGHLECVKMLLNYEADANIKASAGKENMTPLGYAAAKGDYDVVNYLVENGANPELHMRRSKNALMYACMNGHSRIVAYLLNIGVNANARDSSDNTPIHYAAAYGWHNCVQLLLQAGADANIANNWKTTPVSVTLAKHYMEIGDLLLNTGVDVDFVDDNGCTILMKRLQENPSIGQLTVVKHLITKYKADATKVDARKCNMLHYLSQSDVYPKVKCKINETRITYYKYSEELSQICIQIYEMLVKAGTDVNGIDENGRTPVMNAIWRGNLPLVKALIEHGASVELGCTKYERKTLHFVKEFKKSVDLSDYFKVKEEVLDRQLKAKQENELKIRAQIELIKLLLDCGANVNAIRKDQHSLFTLALTENDFAICDVLLDVKNIDILMYKNRFGENVLHMLACLIGNKESLELLKKMLKKVQFSAEFTNSRDHNGLTPLLVLASQLGDFEWESYDEIDVVTEFVDLLLFKCKADVNAQVEKEVRGEKIQRSPLGITVDIDAEDKGRVEEYKDFGNLGLMNVFHISAFVKMPGKILKRILERVDASSELINQKDRHGRTPLHYDLIKGGFNTKILLEAGASPDILSENINADHKAPALVLATRFVIGKTEKAKQPENANDKVGDENVDEMDEDEEDWDEEEVDDEEKENENEDSDVDELDVEDDEMDDDEEEDDDDEEDDDVDENDKSTNEDAKSNNISRWEPESLKNVDHPRFSNKGSLELMIEKCTNVGDFDMNGRNAGHWLALNKADDERKMPILCHLIERGLDINVQDTKAGRSMLHYLALCNTGDYETTNKLESYLISQGARLDITCIEGRYPLHYAFCNSADKSGKFTETSICDPMSLVNVFCQDLENKLNPSEVKEHISHQDNYGDSPLHFGCQRGATISCMQLKKLGADDTIKNKDGNTPLGLALKNDYSGTAMMLLQKGSNPYCDLITKVTEEQRKSYEQKIDRYKYKWDEKVEKPADVIVSAFAYALRKDWKDLAYIMMEVSKLPMFDAIKASILEKKLNLIWTLLGKHPNSKLTGVDENQQNLLHLLAANSHSSEYFVDEEDYSVCFDQKKNCLKKPLKISKDQTVVNLAKHFINAGMNVENVDSNGATPLHLAAKDDFPLAIFLVNLAPNMINIYDNDGKTPLVYAMDVSSKLAQRRQFIKFLMENGANVNVVYKERLDGIVKRTSLLRLFVKKRNELLIEDRKDIGQMGVGCLEYLLDEGADVNTVVDDGTTPLMLAIRLNYKDIINLLMKRKPQLNHQDKNGNSYLHACVQTMEFGSYENVELLKIFLKAGVPVNLVNNFNETALDVAKKQKSGVMAKELEKKYHKAIANKEVTEHGEFGYVFKYKWELEVDHVKDSKLEIERKIANVVKDVEEDVFQVDKHAKENLPGKVSLYCDPVNNRPYDASLLKVDVAWGSRGLNTFYKLQVIHHHGKGLWILFNRWGRENRGNAQHQQTPFDTPEEAVSEFKKIFQSKTGNHWSNYNSFEKKPKKYNLIRPERNLEKMKKYHKKLLEKFPSDEELPPNQINKDLLTLVKSITKYEDISTDRAFSFRSLNDRIPYGSLSLEQLEKALDVLDKISQTIKEMDETDDEVKYLKLEELAKLSADLYMAIPSSNFDIEDVKFVTEKYTADKLKEDLYDMMELNYAYRILLGAQHRMKDINPYDYCYSALDCRLETIAPECDEAKLISQYIFKNNNDFKDIVSAMFRVERKDAYKNNELHNKRMLWHGTDAGLVMTILRYGLQIADKHTKYPNYGQGIYFSHDFRMAMHCSKPNKEQFKHILLCEVALGDMFIAKDFGHEYPVKNTHSTWVPRKYIPDPEEHVTMPYGPVLMIGKDVENPIKAEFYEFENQVVVYDPTQVRIRYIVQVKGNEQRGFSW